MVYLSRVLDFPCDFTIFCYFNAVSLCANKLFQCALYYPLFDFFKNSSNHRLNPSLSWLTMFKITNYSGIHTENQSHTQVCKKHLESHSNHLESLSKSLRIALKVTQNHNHNHLESLSKSLRITWNHNKNHLDSYQNHLESQ